MDEWNALEEAIQQQRWTDAAGLARAFLAAWKEAKPSVMWFAPEDAETYMSSVDATLADLASLLEQDPVDQVAVHAAKAKMRALLPPVKNP